MKVLITGALGHIGSSLIRSLSKNNNINKIFLIDNLISLRYCSLFSLPKNTKYSFKNLNISNCKIEEIPKADYVIHLAAKTDAAQSAGYEEEFYSNNLKATKNIIKYCKKNSCKLIFASSTSVYGPQSTLVDENCKKSELKPQSPYADIKLFEEKLIYKSLLKEKFIILRLGTIYGFSSGIRFHTAVNKFCLQACMGKPLTVWSTAYNQKRPYLNLNDFNNIILHILNKKLKFNNIYNAVSKNLTVKEVIDVIKLFKKVSIKYVNHPIMNQMSYEVSNKKILNSKFKFKSEVKKNIKETINKLNNIN